MSVSIQVPSVLRRFTENRSEIAVDAANVRDALTHLTVKYPILRAYLYNGDGELRSFVNVYLGDRDIRHLDAKHDTPLKTGDVLTIVPSIAGGTDSTPLSSPLGKGGSELTAEEYRRYSRHLLLPEVGVGGQKRLKAASVLVIGAGGLGSPLLAYLAAAGIGRIGIVDSDVVDETNLQRQIIHGQKHIGNSKLLSAKEFIHNLNPNVRVDLFETYFTSENALVIGKDYDILIDGTDNFPTRYLVNDAAFILGKPNVYGSIYRFEGQASVFCAEGGPCYRCLYPEPPPPGLVPSCAEGGVLGVLPGIIGTIQANEAIKLIVGIGEPLVGRLLRFDALKTAFSTFRLQKDPNCPLCGIDRTIFELQDYVEFCGLPDENTALQQVKEMTARELAARISESNGRKPFVVDVRNPEELDIAKWDFAYNIPLYELEGRLNELVPHRNEDIVLTCRTGTRSARAWHILKQAGFRSVYNLEGGVHAWSDDVDPAMTKY